MQHQYTMSSMAPVELNVLAMWPHSWLQDFTSICHTVTITTERSNVHLKTDR